ncbi:hypothetical protein IG193_01085 [Infirmifilum lucidum]|uniref:Uncharacterized protein n=1 Tax=Infirmifilum lucidum TaxID=2776706 RepID=A0A7L9FHG5_9CREN|nr:hypothetical protein [Infirmifilum lucidum]QOJ79091.1 hypothetical protein IG193_01085 [Infirmifilum lucidum]
MTPRNFYDLAYAYLKVLSRKPSVLLYLALLPVVFYTLDRLLGGMPPLEQELAKVVIFNTALTSVVFGLLFQKAYAPRRLLCLEAVPAAGWRVDSVASIFYAPLLALLVYLLRRSSLELLAYMVALNLLAYFSASGFHVASALGFLLGLRYGPAVSAVFIASGLLSLSERQFFSRRVLPVRVGGTYVGLTRPLYLWFVPPILLYIVAVLKWLVPLLTPAYLRVGFHMAPFNSSYSLSYSLSYANCTEIPRPSDEFYIALTLAPMLGVALLLALSVVVAGLRYLDVYFWAPKLLRGTFKRDFAYSLALNLAYGLAVVWATFYAVQAAGLGSTLGVDALLAIYVLAASLTSPSLDDAESLGAFLFSIFVLVPGIQWALARLPAEAQMRVFTSLHAPEHWLLLAALLLLAYLIHVLHYYL